MATMISNALSLSCEGTVESSNVDEDRVGEHGLATGFAIDEETHDERWLAFDRLLQVSFGTIPPAYLFGAPPLDL